MLRVPTGTREGKQEGRRNAGPSAHRSSTCEVHANPDVDAVEVLSLFADSLCGSQIWLQLGEVRLEGHLPLQLLLLEVVVLSQAHDDGHTGYTRYF